MARAVHFLVFGAERGPSIAGKGREVAFFHLFLADGSGRECFIGPSGVADVDHLKMILNGIVCSLFGCDNCFVKQHDGLRC